MKTLLRFTQFSPRKIHQNKSAENFPSSNDTIPQPQQTSAELKSLKKSVEKEDVIKNFRELAVQLKELIASVPKTSDVNPYYKSRSTNLENGTIRESNNDQPNAIYNQFDNSQYIYHKKEYLINLFNTEYRISATDYTKQDGTNGLVILLVKDPFGLGNSEITSIKLENNEFYVNGEKTNYPEIQEYFPIIEEMIGKLKQDIDIATKKTQ